MNINEKSVEKMLWIVVFGIVLTVLGAVVAFGQTGTKITTKRLYVDTVSARVDSVRHPSPEKFSQPVKMKRIAGLDSIEVASVQFKGVSHISTIINDTADVLRSEWQSDILDSANVVSIVQNTKLSTIKSIYYRFVESTGGQENNCWITWDQTNFVFHVPNIDMYNISSNGFGYISGTGSPYINNRGNFSESTMYSFYGVNSQTCGMSNSASNELLLRGNDAKLYLDGDNNNSILNIASTDIQRWYVDSTIVDNNFIIKDTIIFSNGDKIYSDEGIVNIFSDNESEIQLTSNSSDETNTSQLIVNSQYITAEIINDNASFSFAGDTSGFGLLVSHPADFGVGNKYIGILGYSGNNDGRSPYLQIEATGYANSNKVIVDFDSTGFHYDSDYSAIWTDRNIPDKAYVDSYFTGSLTDGTPTATEINTVTSLTPATAGANRKFLILDSDGTGLWYWVISTGSNWIYFPGVSGTTAL